MQVQLPAVAPRVWRSRFFTYGEWLLLLSLVAEIAIFKILAPNFFTRENLFEIARFSIELGLIATALTPVVITGGIDLSVGSMMGLAAVSFGALWRDAQIPLPLAAFAALVIGAAGGALNALFIAQLKVPALVVTLGTFSLFRGIAEGITNGAVNYSGWPESFLYLGQGYLFGVIPVQVLLFLPIFTAYIVMLHRSVIGRSLYTIGFSPTGAVYAGLPVRHRIALVYFLSGLVASLAAIVYVAHVGQAKSDVGTGYEIEAITAVVLGGTSVFGGRGRLWGTLLGLSLLSVLQNGLHMAALPSELTGVLTGVLLLVVIGLDAIAKNRTVKTVSEERNEVKNTQVAVLCGAVLLGAMIVAGTNVWLIRSLGPRTGAPTESATNPPPGKRRPVIAVMPKAKGDPYFVSARTGAEEAAKELGVDLIWDGPTTLDAAKQNELVENWITRNVDAIAVAVENKAAISTVLRKARQRGIPVLTWDADAEADARDYFVNQATPEGIANALTDEAARILNGKGEFAIITGALSAANQNEWIANIKKRMADKHPGLTLAVIRPSDDDRDKAFSETQTILKVYPRVKLMMAISAPAVPGSAEAVSQAARSDVAVIGLSLPSICRPFIHAGVVQTVVLWNTADLGYLTVYASALKVQKRFPDGAKSVTAGRLGTLNIRGSEIVLGEPLLINRKNVDQFSF